MKTILDKSYELFLNTIFYEANQTTLNIHVEEGEKNDNPVSVKISANLTIENCYKIQSSPNSKKYLISFEQPLLWQVVDESYTTFVESEKKDEGKFVFEIQNSKYHKYALENFGWFEQVHDMKSKLYEILTVNEIIQVISFLPPKVSLITK